MSTSSARPDDLDTFVSGSRGADDELRTLAAKVRAAYTRFQDGTRWGHLDASSLINGFGTYIDLNEIDARWVAQIAAAFRAAGGDGDLSRLPDAAIEASLRAAGLTGGRASITFDDPVAYGFPATTGYADDPVNTASGNFLIRHTDLPAVGLAASMGWRRTYNSRSDAAGAFGPGWSSWADCRLHARPEGADYAGPDGQRAVFPRQGAGYGRVLGIAAVVEPDGDGLALRWFDGRRWRFDAAGRPVTATEGPGTSITFAWSGARLTALAHAGGRSLALEWTGDRITAARSSDGRRVDYAFTGGVLVKAGDTSYTVDDADRVVAVLDADGVAEATNTYDVAGRVLTQVSRFGRLTRFAYLPGGVTVTTGEERDSPANTYVHDAHGRLLSVVDGHGHQLSRTYDEWGDPVTVTERNGAVATTLWDERGRAVRRVQPDGVRIDYAYDELDRVVRVGTASGGAITYRYAGAERTPQEIVDAEGGVTRLDVSDGLVHRVVDPDGVALTLGHDADGALISVTDADGNSALLERDAVGRAIAAVTPLGRRTTFEYDEPGRLVARREPDGAVWRYEYTAAGRRTAIIDPTGARREIRYGDHGAVEATSDPLGHTTVRDYDSLGNIARVLAPGGVKWDYRYDALSRLTSVTDPAGATWVQEYDVVGNLIATVDPVGSRYTATVDVAGRVTALSDGVTSAAFEFDELGRAVAHRRPDGTAARAAYDRCGRRIRVQGPDGGVEQVEYTPAGRVRSTTSPAGRRCFFDYDHCGRLVARTDGAGRRTTYRYDADWSMIERVLPDGSSETFRYDAAGRLVRRRTPGEGVRQTEYDAAGRPIAMSDRMAGTRRFAYDAAGRMVTATDALGGVTRYDHDERGHLVAVTDPLGATTRYGYDAVGRVTTTTDPLGRVTTTTYDQAGRIVGRTTASGRTVRWQRDASGRISAVSAGDAGPIVVQRDALGRMIAADEPGAPRIEQEWDAAGRLIARRRGGAGLTWEYDPDGNRAAIGGPDGGRIEFAFDGGNLPARITDPVAGPIDLTRDAAGRLIGAGRSTWRYVDGELAGYDDTTIHRDADGRVDAVRTGDTTQTFGYDAGGQLISAGELTFAYDAAGRLVREGETEFRYDAAGQLRSAGGLRFEYDADGRRTAEIGPGHRVDYRWDAYGRLSGVGPLDVRVDATGELAEVGGVPVLWDSTDPAGPPCWIGDRLAHPTGERADWQGTVGGTPRDPWGAPAADHLGPGYRGELEFAGHVWLRDRVYAPATRSFLQPDPLDPEPGTPWSANPYHYAGNNPISLVDPLGRKPVTDEQLRNYRDDMAGNAFERGADFVADNAEYILAGAAIVGGVALMFTGVGGPAGVGLLALSGALISGGVSVGMQKATTGTVDWGQAGKDFLIGGLAGGVGGGAAMALGRTGVMAATNPMIRGSVIGSGSSAVSGMVARGLSGENPFDPGGLARDLLIGGATGAVGGFLGAPTRPRLPQDIAVSPTPPRALPLRRPIGNSPTQNADLQRRIADLQARGATDFRVNQHQVNVDGVRVGINRPDLQYTLNGRRHYEEWDTPSSGRGPGHEERILANDPSGVVDLWIVP